MSFFKTDNIYKITRITGNRNNILGICFGEGPVEVIDFNFSSITDKRIQTSKEEVLNQVLVGLNSINKITRSNYTISKIYYVPSEDGSTQMYTALMRLLMIHYHEGKEFPERSGKTSGKTME